MAACSVFLVLACFVALVAASRRVEAAPRLARAMSVSDGVPFVPSDGVPVRLDTEPGRRLARGSISPMPSSLSPAHAIFGELNARRMLTPMPVIDDAWELGTGPIDLRGRR